MKISIVTPTFNSSSYIKETMDSIHLQSYKNFEHIVIDGVSTDNTLEIIELYPEVILKSEKDSGQSNAINKGFKMATGDILAWQNADDLYMPNAFEIVIDFFTKNPDVDIVYGFYQLIDSESKRICDVYPIDWNGWLFKHGRFVPVQPTVFWRRGVFEEVGFLDEELHYCMDVDFFSRAVNSGFLFKRIPTMIGKFRVHTQSKTQNVLNERAVFSEYRLVLSRNFNYRKKDIALFEIFRLRAKLARFIKINFLN